MIHEGLVYGPVPSRRLGLSLGLNIIPAKTCTLDCLYCQCGRTTRKTLQRRSFYPVREVLAAVRAAVKQHRTEFITFSGAGEPTLNADIGRLIRALRREHRIPVAVITNSTLLSDPQVRRDIGAADLVVPSLDAADQRTFARVDRCHRDLKVDAVIDGLVRFRRQFRGQLWLEIMLVKGVNDAPEHLARLRLAADRVRPDRIHLNTVVRPPAEKRARRLSYAELEQVQLLFGPGSEIADSPLRRRQRRFAGPPDRELVNLVRGRPVTAADAARSLGLEPGLAARALSRLARAGRVRRVEFWGKVFYEAGRPGPDSGLT